MKLKDQMSALSSGIDEQGRGKYASREEFFKKYNKRAGAG